MDIKQLWYRNNIKIFLPTAEDGMIQEEYLLSRSIMQELCTEAAKLKTLGATEMIPTEKFVRLLNVLELNIRGGDRVSPISDVMKKENFYLKLNVDVLLLIGR